MGAGQSSPSTASHTHTYGHDHPPQTALHVLRVAPHSPAAQTSIEPFFDFIVGVEGYDIEDMDVEVLVEEHERDGKGMVLRVWSTKTREERLIPITPSRIWSTPSPTSTSPHPHPPSLLGLSLRICSPPSALDNVWHVLDVLEGSPAESAGLVPFGDWIVGWSGGPLYREGEFYDVVEAHEDKPLRVYVYSYDFDTLREVVLVPNRQWGGEGLLGCVFGFGLFHRIPTLPTSSGSETNNVVFKPESLSSASGSASGSGVEVGVERRSVDDGEEEEEQYVEY